jgi:predicted nuclease of predicted toxin-antitoxin system
MQNDFGELSRVVKSAVKLLWLRLAALRPFAANQLKCLTMNHLHAKPSFPAQAQSSLVKPNHVIFWV